MSEELTAARVQDMIGRAPYHQWLGLKVVALDEDSIGPHNINLSRQKKRKCIRTAPINRTS